MSIIEKLRSLSGNTKVIAKNTLYAFAIKGVALLVSFISMPLFIRYFNNNTILGLWFTLISVLFWVISFDFGISNGMRNHLVKALTNNDKSKARQVVSSGIACSIATTAALTVAGTILIFTLDLNYIFNISHNEISGTTLLTATLIMFAAIMLRFMLNTVTSIYYALQRSAMNNFLMLCVNTLQMLFVLIFRFDNAEEALLYAACAYFVISNLPLVIAGIAAFCRELRECRPHPAYVDSATTRQIMSIGGIFFVCQILFAVIVFTNEFFVSHFWTPEDTSDYTFYYKVSLLAANVVTLAMAPTWSMVTKAYTEKNYKWLGSLYRNFKRILWPIILIQIAIIPFLGPIFNIWLGKGIVDVNYITAFAFACFAVGYTYNSMLSTIVFGLGRMRVQLWCYTIGCALKVALIVIVSRYSDNWTWVVWSNVMILVPYCIFQQLSLNRFIGRLEARAE